VKRVVITGLGVVCPIGNNILQFEAGLIQGKNGISRNKKQNTEGYSSNLLGQVEGFELPDQARVLRSESISDVEEYVLSAAIEAWGTAGLEPNTDDLDRIGVLLGSGGSVSSIEKYFAQEVGIGSREKSRLRRWFYFSIFQVTWTKN